MFGGAQSGSNFSFLSAVKGSFHGMSRHRHNVDKRTQHEAILTWHMEQLAYFLDKVRGLDENGSSLLDNSMIMLGSSLKA